MNYSKAEVFNLDGNTQLEFMNRKTVVVIDKDRFLVCKQFMMENSPDEDFANFLNIPLEKVSYFKHKMQQFEDSLRARRKAAKLEKQKKKILKSQPIRKREISAEERFRRARELISKGLGTNQISKILKVSERSVTRFKRRMREEKQRLKAEGKITVDPNDPDDEGGFKFLAPEEKIKIAEELFRQRLKIQEISEILKISERSVRRWKDRLDKVKECESLIVEDPYEHEDKQEEIKTEVDDADEDVEDTSVQPAKKRRRLYVDKEKVEYAKELMENKLSNKEMSMLLEISIACVRKLKTKINDGTVDELIDDSEDHYNKINKPASDTDVDPDNDPLNVLDSHSYYVQQSASTSYAIERKPKTILRERDMYIARLLRENNIRTMDIAKMMRISERSVTRLLAKTKDTIEVNYEHDIVAEVERMLADKEMLLSADQLVVVEEMEAPPRNNGNEAFERDMYIARLLQENRIGTKDIARLMKLPQQTVAQLLAKSKDISEVTYDLDVVVEVEKMLAEKDESKRNVVNSLLSMNVTVKDISKMLDIKEKTILLWKSQLPKESPESSYDEEEVVDDAEYEEDEFQ